MPSARNAPRLSFAAFVESPDASILDVQTKAEGPAGSTAHGVAEEDLLRDHEAVFELRAYIFARSLRTLRNEPAKKNPPRGWASSPSREGRRWDCEC